MALNLVRAQRLLLGIITSVESDNTTPEDAVNELNELKAQAIASRLDFKANYTLEDFQKIREDYVSYYEHDDFDYNDDDYEDKDEVNE